MPLKCSSAPEGSITSTRTLDSRPRTEHKNYSVLRPPSSASTSISANLFHHTVSLLVQSPCRLVLALNCKRILYLALWESLANNVDQPGVPAMHPGSSSQSFSNPQFNSPILEANDWSAHRVLEVRLAHHQRLLPHSADCTICP